MSETYGCSNCGEDTENEPFSLCDECEKPARPESIAALETQRDELAEALRECLEWIGDLNEKGNDKFERIAEWFHRETGYTRPGKDIPYSLNETSDERNAAWNSWIEATHRRIYEKARAALAKLSK